MCNNEKTLPGERLRATHPETFSCVERLRRYQVNVTPFERLNAALASQYEAGVERYHSW